MAHRDDTVNRDMAIVAYLPTKTDTTELSSKVLKYNRTHISLEPTATVVFFYGSSADGEKLLEILRGYTSTPIDVYYGAVRVY